MKKETSKRKLHKRFFELPSLEIQRILVEELIKWESTTKVTEKEFYALVDRIIKSIPNPLKKK